MLVPKVMNIPRTALSFLLAFAVATLPAVAGVVPTAAANVPASVAASEPMSDCCDHGSAPCEDKTKGNCASTFGCALKCFNFSAAQFSVVVFPLLFSENTPVRMDGVRPSETGSPPFRPPRV